MQLINRLSIPTVIALAVVAAVYYYSNKAQTNLGDTHVITGWTLFGVIILLAVFNTRKKLIAFNIGSVRQWFAFHVMGGFLTIVLFLYHTGSIFPPGLYEQILALLFWLVSLTGIIGLIVTMIFPRRLTDIGYEVTYERVPVEISKLRQMAEEEIINGAEATGQGTLSEFYQENFSWFFQRPRFYLSHIFGGMRSIKWVDFHSNAVKRYLNPAEEGHLNVLVELAYQKEKIDRQYACQDLMRKWLLIHIPLSVAMIGMAIWHLVLVHIYSQ